MLLSQSQPHTLTTTMIKLTNISAVVARTRHVAESRLKPGEGNVEGISAQATVSQHSLSSYTGTNTH